MSKSNRRNILTQKTAEYILMIDGKGFGVDFFLLILWINFLSNETNPTQSST